MPNKCVLILLDGIGDRSHDVLGNLTPLQAAKTPALDRLAKLGSNGLFHALNQGQALPSENAHFIMFGYNIADFPGRGVLEALGNDIDLGNNDVAILSHFASLSKKDGYFLLEQAWPDAAENERKQLAEALKTYETDGIKFVLHYTGTRRNVITASGNVSRFITDTDPFINGRFLIEPEPWVDWAENEASKQTAAALKKYLLHCAHVLKNHDINETRKKKGFLPLNGLVTQRAGQLQDVIPFSDKYGLRGISIASGVVYWGLASYVGIAVEKVKDTDNPGKDLAARLKIAGKLLKDYDFIHVHTKTPDKAAHYKNPEIKKEVIESLDNGISKAIGSLIDDPEVLVVVTADHSTPSTGTLIHSGETVPMTFYGQGVRQDRVTEFNEIDTALGALGSVRGTELMYMILNHLDMAKMHGVMDTPVDQPFWPGKYRPFKI